MRLTLLAIFFAVLGVASAKEVIPKDVQAFIRNSEACEHFAGEFDGGLSEARQKEIEHSVVRYCQRAQNQLKKLSSRYKADPRVMEIIRTHTNESVTSFR